MAKMCDICGIRPATLRVQAASNGETQTLDLCEVDYERLAARQRASSPLESLFGHSYVGPEHLRIGLAEEGEGVRPPGH